MKCLFKLADSYIQQSTWRDIALIKICVCAMGIMLGLAMPKRGRKMLGVVAILAFVSTYVPLMIKFFSVSRQCCAQDIEIE